MNERLQSIDIGPLFWRLIHTPLADMLRGRLTGSLDLGAAIRAAALPPPLADLIRRVARRTRLWRVETADVARELAEHFRDGLAGGRTANELVVSFGDTRQAARLIRRAKLRSRPLFWRLWRRGVQGLAAVAALMIGCFLLMMLRLVTHHPTIAHNYRVDVVAPTLDVPEADRAWPFYRQALLGLTPIPITPTGDRFADEERPGDEYWPLAEKWLDENQAALPLVRQGAARARLGFAFDEPANKPWLDVQRLDPKLYAPEQNGEMVKFLLPEIQPLRTLGRLLEADARRAAAAGKRQDFVSDVSAIVGLAEHVGDDLAFLVVDLVAFSIFHGALDVVDEALSMHPSFLSDDDLRQLAHRIAAYGPRGEIRVRLSGERASLHDSLQRIYSDDGRGGGVLTREGLEKLGEMNELRRKFSEYTFPRRDVQFPTLETLALATCTALAVLPRRELTEAGDSIFIQAEAATRRPLWEAGDQSYATAVNRWAGNKVDVMRYAPLIVYMPAIQQAYVAAERTAQNRDATLVALALTLYHRRQGAWPERLDALVPDLLPAVPPDRFTGRPVGYRLVDGQPVVYSVGADKIDEGGKPRREGRYIGQEMLQFLDRGDDRPPATEGDWALWPPKAKTSTTAAP